MSNGWQRHEPWLYVLALVLAGLLRFASLGTPAINDSEAIQALQAMQIARGQTAVISDAPGYSLFTAALFFLFGEGDAVARLWPALLGTLFCLVPLMFRPILGKAAAILLAILIAIEPGMVALSRTADGSMWALALYAAAAGMLYHRRWAWAGVSLGLAVMGGSTFWAGLLPLAGAYGFVYWGAVKPDPDQQHETHPLLRSLGLRKFSSAFMLTVVLGGTLFLLAPEGLSGIASGLGTYLQGWVRAGNLALLPALLALGLYHPASWIFGLGQGISGLVRRQRLDQALLIFAGVALFQAVFMPGRTYGILLWVVLPLAVLAARALSRPVVLEGRDRIWSKIEAGLVALLVVYSYLSFMIGQNTTNPQDAQVFWIAALGALFLVVLTVALIAWGWNSRVALAGASLALAITLYAYQTSAAVQAGGLSLRPTNQLWRSGGVVDADLVRKTLDDLSLNFLGNTLDLDIDAAGVDSPALVWVLREYPRARINSVQPVGASPAVVITPSSQELTLPEPYRGQDFVWSSRPDWATMKFGQWANWLYNRQAPSAQQVLILWARNDLFPGAPPVVE